jgi:hypothetical protein
LKPAARSLKPIFKAQAFTFPKLKKSKSDFPGTGSQIVLENQKLILDLPP